MLIKELRLRTNKKIIFYKSIWKNPKFFQIEILESGY